MASATPDNDNDGVENFIEIALGSHPFNPASTPEHPTAPFACTDGLDNDLDGHVDGDDLRCHPDFVVLTGADDEELFRQGRQHANEAHPEMNMSDDQIREFIKTDARDA